MVYFYVYMFEFLSILSFTLSMNLFIMKESIFLEYNLIEINSINYKAVYLIDWSSMLFFSVILMISGMVIMYSNKYMNSDKKMNYFIFMIVLFVSSMVLLIFSANMFSMILGWDGLGMISFILIIYYQSNMSLNYGFVTVMINRLGDSFLMICMGCMLVNGLLIFKLYYKETILLFMIIGAITKSAQFPFSSWLPKAMAAPTPVSSLVHSSTLVTAGIYLIMRFDLINLSMFYSVVFLVVSVFTMLISSIVASFESDLKKIIAFSTLSQLGFIMSTLLVGMKDLAFFHLLIHAYFKSMMFMSGGEIIHLLNLNQNLMFMGKLWKHMPFTSMIFLGSTMSLGGFPFMSGFFSKDLILEKFIMYKFSYFLFFMIFLSCMFTVIYSVRLILSIFYLNNKNSFFHNLKEDLDMNLSMLMNFMMSVVGGKYFFFMLFFTDIIILGKIEKLLMLILILISVCLGVILYFNFKYLKLLKVKYMFNSLFYLDWILSMFSKLMKLVYFETNLEKMVFFLFNTFYYFSFYLYKFIYKISKFNLFFFLMVLYFFMFIILLKLYF
uniref:NADH-ubiquinone oxidoreductase chain 5 n=1 Tax=Eustenogaster scitula TaxID=1980568 RepID=A0A509ZW70_9HYME|nr:NADH dehydrogenase subunit 5 [Eustenogaster scitula]ARO89845.1 NADH dehydrogenase subunit 5 [Eustenogaster scitula]